MEDDGILDELIRDYPYISTRYILRTAEEIRTGGGRPGPLEAEIREKNREYATALKYCQEYVDDVQTILDGVSPNKKTLLKRTANGHKNRLIASVTIWQIIITEPEKYNLQPLKISREKAAIINQMYNALAGTAFLALCCL